MNVRLARESDGPAIGRLFKRAAYPEYDVNWAHADVQGWWVLAEDEDGQLVGALALAAGQPFGWIGEVVVTPEVRGRGENGQGRLSRHRPGAVAETLYATALAACAQIGTEIVFGMVAERMAPLRHMLKAHGAVELGCYALLARRVKPAVVITEG